MSYSFSKLVKKTKITSDLVNIKTNENFDVNTSELNELLKEYVIVSVGSETKEQQTIFSTNEIETFPNQNTLNSSLDDKNVLTENKTHISKLLHLKNEAIVEYCVQLLSNRDNLSNMINSIKNEVVVNDGSGELKDKSLGEILSTVDSYLRRKEWNWVSLGVNPFSFYVKKLMEIREVEDKERFIQDSEKFLQIYKSRSGETDILNHNDYWGSLQQIISGKVIADFVAEDYGPLDPIFGVLLNPTTGRVGPGDTGFIHNILFDRDGPMAYHAAVHDAFGYLKTFHNVGPGYNYLGGVSAVETENCMAGQTSGLLFWKFVINNIKEIKSKESIQ
ncbi:uncharacterized protein LOC100205034 isoform X1 [Hydra vulgaris]|uniref:uncharacterized protein LOC100205034 isoform X1 n=2 Tax=Hydra vulgaris TaxID=6087 RepID=UPI001F5FBC9D|nr:uncharacterized protein LOC100205034 isoform X1 [Hydra vulgaris]